MMRSVVSALLLIAWPALARAEENRFQSFETVAERVVGAFMAATDGVRNVRVDLRRRDAAPDANVTLVGVLGMDIKPKEGPAWYSIRLMFGERDGRWTFLTAYHELPSAGPVWAEAEGPYRTLVEGAIGPPGH